MRGKFVVVTGLDGSGTSSVTQGLHQRDKKSIIYTFPEPLAKIRKEVARNIRFRSPESHYFFYMSANILGSSIIEENLSRGINVYSERFYLDTVISHRVAGLPIHLIYETELYKITKPDITIFLGVDENIRQQRITNRPQGKDTLDKILDDDVMRNRFLEEFNRYKNELSIIDTSDKTVDQICDLIIKNFLA